MGNTIANVPKERDTNSTSNVSPPTLSSEERSSPPSTLVVATERSMTSRTTSPAPSLHPSTSTAPLHLLAVPILPNLTALSPPPHEALEVSSILSLQSEVEEEEGAVFIKPNPFRFVYLTESCDTMQPTPSHTTDTSVDGDGSYCSIRPNEIILDEHCLRFRVSADDTDTQTAALLNRKFDSRFISSIDGEAATAGRDLPPATTLLREQLTHLLAEFKVKRKRIESPWKAYAVGRRQRPKVVQYATFEEAMKSPSPVVSNEIDSAAALTSPGQSHPLTGTTVPTQRSIKGILIHRRPSVSKNGSPTAPSPILLLTPSYSSTISPDNREDTPLSPQPILGSHLKHGEQLAKKALEDNVLFLQLHLARRVSEEENETQLKL